MAPLWIRKHRQHSFPLSVMLSNDPPQQRFLLAPNRELRPKFLSVRPPKELFRSPAPPGSAKKAQNEQRHRPIKPNNGIKPAPAKTAAEALVRASKNPRVAPRSLKYPPIQPLGIVLIETDPIREPIQRVKLDYRDSQLCAQSLRKRALSSAAVA